jgi:hypothetical protein
MVANEIRKSTDGDCAAEKETFKLLAKPVTQRDWLDKFNSLWLCTISGKERVVTPVVFKKELCWMDAVTGSVYTSTGSCKSSLDRTLDIKTLRDDREAAIQILKNTKPATQGDSNGESN